MFRIPTFLIGLLLVSAANAEPIQIVAFGGSNTFGKGVARSEAYPAQLEIMLKAAGYDVVVKNEGTNGQTTADELRKIDSSVPEGTRIVIFQPGGNDKRSTKKHPVVTNTKENVETIVQKLLNRKISVIFSGPQEKVDYVKRFEIPTIDEINQLAPDDLQNDDEHLTPNGYRKVAEKMLPLVKTLLDKGLGK
jgi:acyl-CoA thioesterase I